jgi:hypothetical protein
MLTRRAAAIVVAAALALPLAVGSTALAVQVIPPYLVITHLASGSALGVTVAGPFSQGMKLPKLGDYVTVRWKLSPSMAGQVLDVYVASRGSTGHWGPWKRLTVRLTGAHGYAYFHWRSLTPAWISVWAKFPGSLHLTSVASLAVQIRWT